jgi:3-methyladenine DNA glycosylase AlkD
VALESRRALARLARPAGAFDASRYFRGAHDLGFYNVGAATVRETARTIVRRHPDWTLDDAMVFAEALMPDRYLEVKALALEVVARYRRAFSRSRLPRWKRWLSRGYSSNWATTDALCGYLIGPLIATDRALVAQVAGWSRDRSLWVRRASAVSLLPVIRQGEALDVAYGVARVLHADRADLIQKAVGWMLREAGKVDSARLERYLRANGPHIPRTTVRYAIERFSASRRRALLAATKG